MLKKLLLATTSCILLGTLLVINSGSWTNQYLYATALLKYRTPGTLLATDKTGKPLTLRWHLYQPATQQDAFTAIRATLAPITTQTLAPIEHAFTQSVRTQTVDPISEPDKPWQPDEHSLIITAHENMHTPPLGYAHYAIRNTNPLGTITLDELAVAPSAQRRGIAKLLVSSIYKIMPQVARIELYVRPTNRQAQAAYLSYGFNREQIEDADCAKNWYLFIYERAKTHLLQDIARHLQEPA
ncbi:MAG: N-acetyltransferase [Methylophilaceae bacterium]|nr:N-acetyltransferase [Methylophilaceae bacterium]